MSSDRGVRVVDTLILALLALVVLVGAGRAVVAWFGFPAFVITGSSMAPAVPMGSAVLVVPTSPDRMAVGDVVTYQRPGHQPTTHRIVALEAEAGRMYVATKGDANPVADPSAIPAARVLGRVMLVVPVAGYVLWFFSLPTGWLSFVSFLVWLWLAARLVDELRPSGEAAPRARPVVVAGIVALLAGAALLGSAAVRSSGAVLTDVATVTSNTITTGTWAP